VTPEELTDLEEIRALKHAYLRCLDQKLWEEMRTLLTEDAVAAYSGGKYTSEGRDEIVGFLERNMGSSSFHSSHRCSHPEIHLDGDEATGTWALDDTVVDPEMGYLLQGAAFYEDRYVRVDGRWLIARTGYRRTFEYVMPLTALAGFSLTASWWSTGGQSSLPVA
jgi:hypothetical protein